MQIFPASWRNFWSKWELRCMVLLSLGLQTILILLGNKRKYSKGICLRIIIWIAYLSADWLAIVSLSVLSSEEGQPKDNAVEPRLVIMAVWAPFLLLHLGGPDTITAYSMEDNELWLRHLLTFGVQVVVAIYIILRAWNNTDLNFLVIPIFISAIIKIGERAWCFCSASSQQFKESMFPEPDAGPSYARYMEAHGSASYEGFRVDVVSLIESPTVGDNSDNHTNIAAVEDNNVVRAIENDTSGKEIVDIAYNFFKTFKVLFADLILSFHDVLDSRLSLQNGHEGSGDEVFKVMEVELGFMYDLFYTKAAVTYSFVGLFHRFISFSCNIITVCLFFVFEKNQYSNVDVSITYVLFLGAIILEMYSVILLLSSDWTMLWLNKHENEVTDWMITKISSIPLFKKRWSNSISQFNLIEFCLKSSKPRCCILRKIFSIKIGLTYREAIKKRAAKCCLVRLIIGVYQSFEKYMHNDDKIVTDDLKNVIFNQFHKRIKEAKLKLTDEKDVAEEIKKFCAHRGDKALENTKYSEDLGWSVRVEFHQSILLWHIATDLCHNSVPNMDMDSAKKPKFREASKFLSEYMLSLLLMRPSMLPNGIGEIRFQDTCAEATEFIKERKSIKTHEQACQRLLEVSNEQVLPAKVKGDRSKSVLFDACRLAKRLQKIRNEGDEETEKMWELITQVWVEMLAYAASHCQAIQHAQQLRRGGGAAHPCLASYGTSGYNRAVSNFRGTWKDQIEKDVRSKCIFVENVVQVVQAGVLLRCILED